MKTLINILLLIVMGFSIVHGVVMEHESHCDVAEYIEEFSTPIHHDDIHEKEHEGEVCNSHYMYHISFLVPSSFSLLELNKEVSIPEGMVLSYLFTSFDTSFKPPIS